MKINHLENNPEEYIDAFMDRYPIMKSILSHAGVRSGKPLGTELASVRDTHDGIDIVLSPGFWGVMGRLGYKTADFIFMHEIGHLVSSMVGIDVWAKEATLDGIDPWGDLPFNQPNMEEAFAEVFAVIYTNDRASLVVLLNHHPGWVELVQKQFSRTKRPTQVILKN